MRRRSANRDEIETEGNSLTEKWIVPNIPLPMSGCNWPETTESYVEFEDLDRLGRFSYLKHNKETEVYYPCLMCNLVTVLACFRIPTSFAYIDSTNGKQTSHPSCDIYLTCVLT